MARYNLRVRAPSKHSDPNSQQLVRRLSRIKRLLVLVCAGFVLTSVLGAQAFAQANTRLLIPAFQGAKPQGLRTLTVELLTSDGFEVVSETPKLSRKASDSTFADTAAEHEVLAVVLAQTTLDKKSWRTTFTVREGQTGKVVGRTELSSTWYPGLQKAYKESLVARLMKLLEQCQPAPSSAATTTVAATKSEETDAETSPGPVTSAKPAQASGSDSENKNKTEAEAESTSETEPEHEPETPKNASERAAMAAPGLILSIGPAGALRSWTINDSLTEANDGPLLSAHSAPALGLRVALQLFPAAFLTQDSVRHIGLDLRFTRSFVGQTNVANVTNDPDDELRDTVLQSYFAGLHVRIPVAPLQLGLTAGFGEDALTIEGSKEAVAVPDIQAQFVRGALNARFQFIPTTSAQFSIGYRHVLSFGDDDSQLESPLWFPATEGTGLDARLEVQHLLSPWFGLMAGVGLTHYALDFNVGPSRVEQADDADQPPPPLAGGATDLYTTFDVSAVFVVGD